MHPVLLFYWRRTPFLRAVLPLMTGIAGQWYYPLSIVVVALLFGIGLAGLLLFFWLPHRYRFRLGNFTILFQAAQLAAIGSFIVTTADIRSHKSWIGHHIETEIDGWQLEVVLNEEPVEKTATYRIITEALFVHLPHKKIAVTGGVLLYLKKNARLASLKPGDKVLLKQLPERIRNAGNPGELNLAQQWLFRGITHSIYLDSNKYQLLKEQAAGYQFQRWLAALRNSVLDRLHQHLKDPQVKGLAAALMIGYRQDLDPTLSQSYSNTGVIHIIAISGLHLALIGWMLEKLLRPIQKNRFGIFMAQVILLSAIWLFSFIAEASPSVLRAAMLFTVLGLGKLLDRKGNSLNTLAAASFILLCYNPFWLWDLGFQLSFLAVLGILLMGKPLSRFLSHRNFMLHQIGQGIAISIAAQVLTTPLTLYYFHQFPGSFLLSNLVAVPLSSIILGGELLLCLLANLPYAGSWIGWMVEQLIKIMNSYVQGVEAIPGLLWKDLYWSFQETILLFLLSLFLLHWLLNCSAKARQFSLLIGALLLLLQATEQTNRQKQNRLVIYNNRSQTVMELMNSSSSTILVDTGIKTDSNLEKFILGPSHHFFRIKNSQAAKLPISFQYRGWRVVRPDKNYEATNQPADLLLITRSAPFNPGDWAKGATIKLAVIDATCGWRTEERWRSILDSMKVPVHAVKWQGAFVHSFQ